MKFWIKFCRTVCFILDELIDECDESWYGNLDTRHNIKLTFRTRMRSGARLLSEYTAELFIKLFNLLLRVASHNTVQS